MILIYLLTAGYFARSWKRDGSVATCVYAIIAGLLWFPIIMWGWAKMEIGK